MSAIRQAEPVLSATDASQAGLDRERLLRLYRDMLATRTIEERGNLLFKGGRLPGSYYTGRGNEAASVGVASAMGEDDVASPLHRNMGVHVVRGVDPAALFCQYMGRSGGATGGRDSNLRTNDFSPGRGPAGRRQPPAGHDPRHHRHGAGLPAARASRGLRSAGAATAPPRAATCTSR